MDSYRILNRELSLKNQELKQLVGILTRENTGLQQKVLTVEQENYKLKTTFQVILEAAETFTNILQAIYRPNLNHSLSNESLNNTSTKNKLNRSSTKKQQFHPFRNSTNLARNSSIISVLNEKSQENDENALQNSMSFVNVRKKKSGQKNCSENSLSEIHEISTKGDENENRTLHHSLNLYADECLHEATECNNRKVEIILEKPDVSLDVSTEEILENHVVHKNLDYYNNPAEINTILEESTITNESNQSLCKENSSGLIQSMYDNNTQLNNIAEDIEIDELSLSKAVSSTPYKTRPSNNLQTLKHIKISIPRIKPEEINQNSSMEITSCLTNLKRNSETLSSPKEIKQNNLSNNEMMSSKPNDPTPSTNSISKRPKRRAAPTTLVEQKLNSKLRNTEA